MARKGYPAEFRRRALDLVASDKTVAEVARLLEVSDQSIYTWRRQELIDRGELPGLSSAEREELRRRGCGSGSLRPSWRCIGARRSC
jgi:transposase-like protein